LIYYIVVYGLLGFLHGIASVAAFSVDPTTEWGKTDPAWLNWGVLIFFALTWPIWFAVNILIVIRTLFGE
jgi:hypothetical protein